MNGQEAPNVYILALQGLTRQKHQFLKFHSVPPPLPVITGGGHLNYTKTVNSFVLNTVTFSGGLISLKKADYFLKSFFFGGHISQILS